MGNLGREGCVRVMVHEERLILLFLTKRNEIGFHCQKRVGCRRV